MNNTGAPKKASSWDEKGGNLIFVISPARSGSTMLRMMLESHSQIQSSPEPSLLPPLKYLGVFGAFPPRTVYDPVNQSLGLQEFVKRLPEQLEDYLKACRAYANSLYNSARKNRDPAQYFLDKTPSNVLIWDVVTKLYPNAKYVVLTRHPFAIVDSYAESFFLGDYPQMLKFNPPIQNFIYSTANFLREAAVKKYSVKYEDLVANPRRETQAMLNFLELDFEDVVIEYGRKDHITGSIGDPLTAKKAAKPIESYAWKWVPRMHNQTLKIQTAEKILSHLSDQDLVDYGYPRGTLREALSREGKCHPHGTLEKKLFRSYHWKRFIFLNLRKLAGRKFFRHLLEYIRYYCDVLLR